MDLLDRLRWWRFTGMRLQSKQLAAGDSVTVDTSCTVVFLNALVEPQLAVRPPAYFLAFSVLAAMQLVVAWFPTALGVETDPYRVLLHSVTAVVISAFGAWVYRDERRRRVAEVKKIMLDAARGV